MRADRAALAAALALVLAAAGCKGGTCLRHSDCSPGLVCSPAGACLAPVDPDGGDGDAGDGDAGDGDAALDAPGDAVDGGDAGGGDAGDGDAGDGDAAVDAPGGAPTDAAVDAPIDGPARAESPGAEPPPPWFDPHSEPPP